MLLYKGRKYCCGCGACSVSCTVQAIKMKMDKDGFFFPDVDFNSCIQCGKCESVCQYHNTPFTNNHSMMNVYAAISKRTLLTKNSTSAGVFAMIAKEVLNLNGVVCGASLSFDYPSAEGEVRHVFIDNVNDLKKIQGSKYIQSKVGLCYGQCKEFLLKGKLVLFSGTPCQIAALHMFLGREYSNLITIDIVCHGVPSQKMFFDYIKTLESKGKITEFRFRSKEVDSGHNIEYQLQTKDKNVRKKKSGYCSSYNKLFLDGSIYQECCYDCIYAKRADERMGDISLCDYWGLRKMHPDFYKQGLSKDYDASISGVIVNSPKGEEILKRIEKDIVLEKSDFEKLRKYNSILNHPTPHPDNRDKIMILYEKYGYKEVEKYYRHNMGIIYYAYNLFFCLPRMVRELIRRVCYYIGL